MVTFARMQFHDANDENDNSYLNKNQFGDLNSNLAIQIFEKRVLESD